jgi:hypothetical protein
LPCLWLNPERDDPSNHDDQEITMNANADITLNDEERTRCEVWTRVMGYHRPVSAFNAGKRSEHLERAYFSEQPAAVQTLSNRHRAAA